MKRHKSDGYRNPVRNESGQSVILVAIMIVSFLMFFSFTVNTGLLISAKISVQTAADAAAYAGAATEARWMNSISFLNYDMRRQFKKYLFRSMFMGSIGNVDFPNPLDAGAKDYDFHKLDQTITTSSKKMLALKVPVICIPLTMGGKPDDNCLKLNIKNPVANLQLPTKGIDPIMQSMIDGITKIGEIQETICSGQGSMNYFVAIAWLFRGNSSDKDLEAIFQKIIENNPKSSTVTSKDFQEVQKTIEALVRGLGLYPRNIINLMRIETLAAFLNSTAVPQGTPLTKDGIEALEKGPNAEASEKTIQAFKSAQANLNTSVFDQSLTTLTEYQSSNQIKIRPQRINFNAYIQMMKNAASGGNTICNAGIAKFPAVGAPIGISTEPHVNYAVKVSAFVKPRGLLFLPGSDPLELSAVAGAKPFGSRMGPKESKSLSESFVQEIKDLPAVNGEVFNDCKGTTGCYVPDISVADTDTSFSKEYLNALFTIAKSGGPSVNYVGMLNAQRHAMAPTPQEIGHYNVLPRLPKDLNNYAFEFIDYNTTSATGTNPGVYRFYAPIFQNGGDSKAKVDQFLADVFPETQVDGDSFGIKMKDIGAEAGRTIKNYISNDLAGAKGENGETTTMAAIELPMAEDAKEPPSGKRFWLTQPEQVMSSWAPSAVRTNGAKDVHAFDFKPRFGYSVKFYAMPLLLGEGVSASDDDLSNVSH